MDPGDAGRAADAAEAEQRHPPDVGAQPDPVGDPGLDRRDGDPGDRGGHDQVDVARARSPARSERAEHGPRPRSIDGLDERVVGRAEVVEVAVALERQRQVPATDLGAGVQPLEQLVPALGAEADLGEQPR